MHRRIVLLNKKTRRFVIEDRLEGRGRHRIEWFFHLGPRCAPAGPDTGPPARFRAGAVEFGLLPLALPKGARGFLEEDLFSPGYGRVERSRVVRFEWTGDLPAMGRFAVEPGGPRSGRAPGAVEEVP